MNYFPLCLVCRAAVLAARQTKQRGVGVGIAVTQGGSRCALLPWAYSLLAPPGRQMEPPDLGYLQNPQQGCRRISFRVLRVIRGYISGAA